MTLSTAQRYALIAQIVHDYNSATGRPAGKKAVQKLFYVLQRRSKEAQYYGFSFYNYGVYSQDLARDIAEAERYDFIDVSYDAHLNAYSIEPSDHFENNKQFLPRFYSADVCKDVLNHTPRDLELITTIMFVCDEEKISQKENILQRVLDLKPKFSDREVMEFMPHFCGCE